MRSKLTRSSPDRRGVGASSSGVDASLPSRDEESLSDDSLLTVDASFGSASRLENRRQLAPSETPHEVDEEFPSPTPAAESSERNQSHPSIPAQARLLARPSLPAPVTPAASVAMLSRQALPPRLYPSFRPPCLPARAPAKSHLGSRCPARGKNNSRPGKRLRGTFLAAVRWAKERVR